MKPPLLIIFLILFTACITQKKVISQSPKITGNDSASYKLLVFEPGFESWYAIKHSKVLPRDKLYYHNWNIQYLNEWNSLAKTPGSGLIRQPIDYDANTDYPLEIEFKLFYYFQYVVHVLGISILDYGPLVY